MALQDEMYGDEWDMNAILAEDKSGQRVREILDALIAARMRLKGVLDKGVPPEEFKKGEALLGSYDAALQGIEKAWERHRRE